MNSASAILEERTFRLLPEEDLGFAKPALRFRDAEGTVGIKLAARAKGPEPELARKPHDPGWWTITVWLPVGATPVALVPDPNGPQL